jgi:hypothetical protein
MSYIRVAIFQAWMMQHERFFAIPEGRGLNPLTQTAGAPVELTEASDRCLDD